MADTIAELKKELAMEIAEEIRVKIDENLTRPMPWEPARRPAIRDTIISDIGFLLRSTIIEESEEGADVAVTAPYSDIIEFGAPPHFIPTGPIIKWAKRKLGLTEKKAISLAYATQNTVKKHGRNPHRFVTPAIDMVIADNKRV